MCLSFPWCAVGTMDCFRNLGPTVPVCRAAVLHGGCAILILQIQSENLLSVENEVQTLLRSHRCDVAALGLEPKSGLTPEPTHTPVGSCYRVLALVGFGVTQSVSGIIESHYHVSSFRSFGR